MKKIFFPSAFLFLASCFSFGQTVLYNGGTDITVGNLVFVDGDIVNDVQGHIHNTDSIYLTRHWTNNEPTGCLDPTTGTVFLDGGAQFIQGTQTTTFNNLTCVGSGLKTLNINTIVGGNTGVLSLLADPFDLNSKTLIVTNPLPAAITRTSGYIISETYPTAGYGIIDWRMRNSAAGNNYTYPFGTVSGSYIPFLFDMTSAGVQSTVGSIAAATYPTIVTASPNNRPFPTGITNLNDSLGNESATTCLDRYWIINANNYSTNPVADYTFTYRDLEWDNTGGSTNNIHYKSSLLGWKWNGTQWQNPRIGINDSINNTVIVTGQSGSAPWTLKGTELVCGEFFLPNAFSPNGDGKNDFFRPRSNCIKTLDFKIYNRWGNMVYTSTSPADKGWDGTTPQGKCDDGVYAYQLNATFLDNTSIEKKGTVTLLK